MSSIVNPSDVSAARDRFSFDFDESYLVNGDFVEFTTADGTNLDFVDATGWANGVVQSSGNWYISIDELGGIKLYDNFDDSLEGSAAGLVPLVSINRDIPILVTVRNQGSRALACIIEYEINTSREAVDFTALGDQYRQQYSTLITGSGRVTAQWDYVNNAGLETIQYLQQLVIRTEIGSSFRGQFYLKAPNTSAAAGPFEASQVNDALWWEFDALVTSSATNFAPGDIIVSTIEFVATGPIRLKAKTQQAAGYVLQENAGKFELEQDANSFLLLDQTLA